MDAFWPLKLPAKFPYCPIIPYLLLSNHTQAQKPACIFFPTYDTATDTGKWDKPENSPFKERKEQSITVDSKSSSIVLQCTCIEREKKKTKRQSETEREVKRLTGIIQNSVRNTTLKRLNQKRQFHS